MPDYYGSPRWSTEFVDCSMPLTFDTYSRCSYHCVYCFAVFRKAVGNAAHNFLHGPLRSVNVEAVKQLFNEPGSSQFGPYIERGIPMQWGGMADPFDENERKLGVGLGLLRFFRSIGYPICFSTKGAWWASDERYVEAFRGFPWFNVKMSIITMDEAKAHAIERGVPSVRERLDAMERVAKFAGGGVTLRLRPFIIGASDPDGGHLQLIREAYNRGATAVSTEFFCLDRRIPLAREKHYPIISKAVGFDVMAFYKRYSSGSSFMRLNRNIKRPYVDEMQALCSELGLRFYVSDAHFKERCHNGSCCGLPESWPYSRGQGCEALVIARRQGEVRWADIEEGLAFAKTFLYRRAVGYNNNSSENRAAFHSHTMYEWLRYQWNHPSRGQSPYQLFEGILRPDRLDEQGNIVYVFDSERA